MTITPEDREAAWEARPSTYTDADKTYWMRGVFDDTRVPKAFAQHRINSTKAAEARIKELEQELSLLREALGAHLVADGYHDEFPDDEEDAKYLRKSETFWRLSARKWLGDDLAYNCALAARRRGVSEDSKLQAILQKLDGELLHVSTPMANLTGESAT